MKAKASVIILALAAGVIAFMGTRLAVCSRPARAPLGVVGGGLHLKTELGLTEKQAAEIQRLDGELRQQLADQCGRYCTIRAELGEVLMAEGPDAAGASRRLVEQMCSIQSASELATLEHVRKVSTLLNPAQRKQFLSNLTKCLCGSGGLCAGGCMAEDQQ